MKFDLKTFTVIFWDFDGVIKDSVDIKTKGYVRLFSEYGEEVGRKIQEHHLTNSGVSRLKKIPYYMEQFVGKKISAGEIERLCLEYSRLTINGVLESAWIGGVYEYLKNNHKNQDFYVASGTPIQDLDIIVKKLGLGVFFKGIFGAPVEKSAAVRQIMDKYQAQDFRAVFIGDGLADYEAAQINNIGFLLRETADNQVLFKDISCPRVKDFTGFLR